MEQNGVLETYQQNQMSLGALSALAAFSLEKYYSQDTHVTSSEESAAEEPMPSAEVTETNSDEFTDQYIPQDLRFNPRDEIDLRSVVSLALKRACSYLPSEAADDSIPEFMHLRPIPDIALEPEPDLECVEFLSDSSDQEDDMIVMPVRHAAGGDSTPDRIRNQYSRTRPITGARLFQDDNNGDYQTIMSPTDDVTPEKRKRGRPPKKRPAEGSPEDSSAKKVSKVAKDSSEERKPTTHHPMHRHTMEYLRQMRSVSLPSNTTQTSASSLSLKPSLDQEEPRALFYRALNMIGGAGKYRKFKGMGKGFMETASEAGDVLARHYVLLHGLRNPETKQRPSIALKRWLLKHPDKEDPYYQYLVGWHHRYGLGVPQCNTEAQHYLEKAAAEGEVHALYELGLIMKEQSVRAKTTSTHETQSILLQQRDCFERASKQDHGPSLRMLGLMYAKGEGTEKDMKRAVELWKTAAIAGDTESSKLLTTIAASP